MDSSEPIIRHLGLIMDGNRRWAKEHNKPVAEGHKEGFRALKALMSTVKELKIEYLSIYSFSSDNWKRKKEEVDALMALVRWVLKNEIKSFKKENIRLRVIGSRQNVPADILELIEKAEADTADRTGGTLAICFNYGGKEEILDATRSIIRQGLKPADVTKEVFEQNLYSNDIPPVDMVVRTSGEHRTSGFMLWRSDYSELMFLDKYWPDFCPDDLYKIVEEYSRRKRRYGK